MLIGFKSHPKRGEEIINILKMLGGVTKYTLGGKDYMREGIYWYIDPTDLITWNVESKKWNVKLFTLEEFEKQYPYKVGDYLDNVNYLARISAMKWNHITNKVDITIETLPLGGSWI